MHVDRKSANQVRSVIWGALLAVSGAAAQDGGTEPAGPQSAVHYIERQLRDQAAEDLRRIPARTNQLYGIDINSSVDIDIDAPSLSDQVMARLGESEADSRVEELGRRIGVLQQSLAEIEGTVTSLQALFRIWSAAESDDDYTEFLREVESVDARIFGVLESVRDAIELRLRANGLSDDDAVRRANEAMSPALSGGNQAVTYNWDALRRLYADEIAALESDLASVADGSGLEIEIQGHLLQGSPTGIPIFLPGYNQVATGPATIVQKVRYEIPPEAIALRDQHQALADEIDATKSLGRQIVDALEARYREQQQAIRGLLDEARSAADAFAESLDSLSAFAETETLDAWFADIGSRLPDRTEAGAIVAAWGQVQAVIGAIESDIEALREFGRIGDSLVTAPTAESALASLQGVIGGTLGAVADNGGMPAGLRVMSREVWQDRLATFTAFFTSLDDLSGPLRDEILSREGPGGAIADIRSTSIEFGMTLAALPGAARELLFGASAVASGQFAANLPTPVGQERLGLTAAANLDTSFDLKTISQTREETNEIWITYRLFRGEEDLGLGWTDKFMIREFGWRDHATAGVAFALQDNADTWKPTANLSWLLKKRPWPTGDETGLRGIDSPEWYSGFGLSTLPLEFEDSEDIEVGIALTGSFMNNRIMVGYGTNLQGTENDNFWFISFRLFQSDGLVNPLTSQ